MPDFSLKKRYEIFLYTLNKELQKMFDNQAEFIKCKEGCSYCCEKGEYPFSELEFNYLIEGYKQLDSNTKKIIKENIKQINKEKSKNTDKIFMHKCPFLINKRCSVYNNRGIICRTFGLLCEHNDGRLTIPFCHEYGLNYAQLYDKELGQLIDERDGIKLSKTEPAAFRIERDNIMNLSIAKNLNIVWGDSKTMIDFINQTNIDN